MQIYIVLAEKAIRINSGENKKNPPQDLTSIMAKFSPDTSKLNSAKGVSAYTSVI